MFAIVKTGGKQYKLAVGDEVFVEKLVGEAGDQVVLDQVLAVSDNGDLKVGKPTLEGGKVTCEIVKQGKGKKLEILKYKAKKGYRRRQGHRQPYTKLQVKAIDL